MARDTEIDHDKIMYRMNKLIQLGFKWEEGCVLGHEIGYGWRLNDLDVGTDDLFERCIEVVKYLQNKKLTK